MSNVHPIHKGMSWLPVAVSIVSLVAQMNAKSKPTTVSPKSILKTPLVRMPWLFCQNHFTIPFICWGATISVFKLLIVDCGFAKR